MKRLLLAFIALGIAFPAFAQAPAPVPALPDTERRTSYSISGTTCACNINFQLFGDGVDFQNWVEVYVNSVRVDYNDPTSGWKITSPSGPLSNLARPISDAVLTFNATQTGTVQIVGARRPRRTAQFSESQGVSARNLNQTLSDLTAQNREVWDKINDVTGRALLAVPGETLPPLPAKATRLNQGVCFDNNGYFTSCVSVPTSTFSAGNGISFSGTNPTTITNNISAGNKIVFTGTNPIVISSPDTITVGTTTISGGTTLGMLFNNAGVLANSSFVKQITNGVSTPTIAAGTNGSSGDDAAFIAVRNVAPASGLLNSHAFRDESTAVSNATASQFSGYASFDCAPLINGANVTLQNHVHCFQARAVYNNIGAVTEWVGYTAQAAAINTGQIVAAYGFQMQDGIKSGGGTIGTQYAIYSNPLSAGTLNYFLYGAGTNGSTANPSVLNGNLYVGGRTAQQSVEVSNFQFNGTSQQGIALLDSSSAGSGGAVEFYKNSSAVGSITVTTSGTTYNATSDERLKSFTGQYSAKEAIRIIRADPVRTFDWKATGDHDLGWGAQTSFAISRDLATPGTGKPGDKNFRPWGVDKGKRTPYLWAAMSDVLDRLDALERKVQ